MTVILLCVGLIDFDPVMVCLWCKSVLRIVFVLLSNRTSICAACGLRRLHPMDSLSCPAVAQWWHSGKVLCCKSEGRWLHSRWCHWNFSLT
jgi:hypothetical protein